MPPARFITIHGHFYQPPRENPWLEAVETQDSAHPYHDWNERITAECYGPNASARILDVRDRIRRIINNYSWISFNFGATLMSWLEERAPDVYASILDADRESMQRFGGHGSAIAQVYNHVILPLANERDQRTQVRWGIRDFEWRFGRKPEGMWLPETAVDIASLEALAAEGIRFTVLEPHQAAGPVDPTMAYVCSLPSGAKINIFFYDGPISRAVAFEQLLARGENLAHRIVGAFSEAREHPQVVNIATDGETYGHHHRYGEMALAYALQYIEEHDLAKITNYGEYLELHPPTEEVEILENTAWSCAHGLERWRSDCGCNTGAGSGWNQRWRTPLRDALDWLRDEAAEIFEREGAKVLRDPWGARDAYIDVVLHRTDEAVDRFIAEWAAAEVGGATSGRTILELLEMQRNAMLMYTSCGWFFNDVSGIETVQVLHYAARVIQLAEAQDVRLENEFVARLAAAQSNLPEKATAREIYEREVRPTRLDLRRVAGHYAVASLFDTFDDEASVYCYRVRCRDYHLHRAGRARMALGSIVVRSRITREEAPFEFAVIHLGETELIGGVRAAGGDWEQTRDMLAKAFQPGSVPFAMNLLQQHFGETQLSIRNLFRDEQRRILNLLCNATLEEAESAFRQLHERYDPLMRFHTRLGIPLPKVLQTAAEFDINLQLRRLLDDENLHLAEIDSRLREARDERIALDETTLLALKSAVERAAGEFRERPDDVERLESYTSFVGLVHAMQLHVDLRKPQNDYYRMSHTIRPAVAAQGNGSSARWLELFDSLGEKLWISTEARA